MGGSALATAALTSVALFSQTADAVPLSGEDIPSRDEVQQRVNTLYDQAENATGNYNATRAMTTGARRRGEPAPTARPRRDDPSLDAVTRQWFDGVRARLGPTVPAVLPRDRAPEVAAPARPAERPVAPEPAIERAPAVPELPAARPVLELTAGPATAALPPAATGAIAALPAVPGPRQETAAAPAADTQRSSLRTSKEQNQRKLAEARDLLTRYAMVQRTPVAAIAAPPAQESWPTSPGLPAVTDTTPALPVAEEMAWQQPAPFQTQTQVPVPAPVPALPVAEEVAWQQPAPYQAQVPFSPLPVAEEMAWQQPAPYQAQIQSVLDTGHPVGLALSGPVVLAERASGGKAVRALEFARAQIGRPCVWGATGPESYDCASLTQAAWRAAGVALPRNAPDQASAGTVIPLGDVQPGDLIFFYDNLSHLGLYTGDGMMIHAPGPGTYIREESVYFAGESAVRGAVRLA
ncbi:NlpC/P60 family protein [Streptomyces sp. NPDC005574]|uniref:C40 family peptidase n=1 Tax=Streptomyces sp. NPDC005574 TaxID=3156891 RepID=UPI00339F3614